METEVTDPIREDVSDVTTGSEGKQGTEGNAPDPRDEAIARIEQANLERMAQDQATFEAQQAGGEAPTPEPGRREEPQGSAETTSQMVKVLVDGEERELPLAEVVKGYQKDSAATQRLRDAADRLKEVELREKEVADREKQLKLQTSDPEDGTATTDYEAIDNAIDALLEGDKDPMRELLGKASSGGNGAGHQVSQEEIDKVVDRRISEREIANQHATAQAAFKKDYQDIFDDPFLLDMANKRYFAKLEEGKTISESMLEAGKETREWLDEKTGGAAPDPLREKLERKKSRDTITPAGSRTAGGAVEEDYSPQAIIAQMKKDRGQA